MKTAPLCLLSTLIFLLGAVPPLWAAPWKLPLTLNDNNTKVTFEVDSTWHLVRGATAGIAGTVWLEFPDDESSIRGEVRVPVGEFDTDNKSRDERLREVMAAEKFPAVVFTFQKVTLGCRPAEISPATSCPVTVAGTISIRGNQRPLTLTGALTADGQYIRLTGTGTLRWPDFGVEDPSIFFARLYPEVQLQFSTTIPRSTEEHYSN